MDIPLHVSEPIPLHVSESMHHVAVVCMSVPPQVGKPKAVFADT
jgi:hypothetical protein